MTSTWEELVATFGRRPDPQLEAVLEEIGGTMPPISVLWSASNDVVDATLEDANAFGRAEVLRLQRDELKNYPCHACANGDCTRHSKEP